MDHFNEHEFKNNVSLAIKKVKDLLGNERTTECPEDVQHAYKDKYELIEWHTKGNIVCILNILAGLQLTESQLRTMVGWAQKDKQTVSLKLSAIQRCKFEKEVKKEVPSATTVEREVNSSIFGRASEKIRSVTTVKEYWFSFSNEWCLSVFAGASGSGGKQFVVQERTKTSATLKMSSKSPPPHPEVNQLPDETVDITWLLKQLLLGSDSSGSEPLEVQFVVDRAHEDCRTPRRNPEVNAAFAQFFQLDHWANRVNRYMRNTLIPIDPEHSKLKLSDISAADIFTTIIPLFEEQQQQNEEDDEMKRQPSKKKHKSGKKGKTSTAAAEATAAAAAQTTAALALMAPGPSSGDRAQPTDLPEPNAVGVTLTLRDAAALLAEHARTVDVKREQLLKAFPEPSTDRVCSAAEAIVASLAMAMDSVCRSYWQGCAYVEHMLRQQLIAAIGKTVGPHDFDDYMVFHSRRLFRPEFQPQAFCYSIRRPAHTPEGVISLERSRPGAQGDHEPVTTICASHMTAAGTPMRFQLDASTDVELHGHRFVHACVGHRFSDTVPAPLRVTARARQFSGFVLMLGRVVDNQLLDISDAIIVSNKTEVNIPLDVETIPTAQEFRDAIESLSPAQQRFAKAFRSMQLSHTLFCLVVVQIKPQLERLLNLPADALTKKIQLTEDLKELFMKYQIPSDLVSFGGDKDQPVDAKVQAVEQHVGAMKDMLKQAKEVELEDARMVAEEAVMDEVAMGGFGGRMRGGGGGGGGGGASLGVMKKSKARRKEMSMAPAAPMLMSAAPPPPMQAPAPAQMSMMSTESIGAGRASAVAKTKPVADSSPPTTTTTTTTTTSAHQPMDVDGQGGQAETTDISSIPNKLDRVFEQIGDKGGSVRPTILNVGKYWQKKAKKGLLRDPTESRLSPDDRKTEKQEAFDLLDALSRSGSLAIEDTQIHVVMASTHCFDESLMNVLVKQNLNPIEHVERTLIAVGRLIHGTSTEQLIQPDRMESIEKYNPMLLE